MSAAEKCQSLCFGEQEHDETTEQSLPQKNMATCFSFEDN